MYGDRYEQLLQEVTVLADSAALAQRIGDLEKAQKLGKVMLPMLREMQKIVQEADV